jgi:AraC-like DNA-binding protein
MVVKLELEKLGFENPMVELGEVELKEEASKSELEKLDTALRKLGFELLDDKKTRIIEKIKNIIVQQVHHSTVPPSSNLSDLIADKLHYDYTYLSNLFTESEGITIEKYFIAQRIEKVKELLVYDELSLTEIADMLNYSSSAYLSSQFKKVTGLTPSFYKSLKEKKRKNIEEL